MNNFNFIISYFVGIIIAIIVGGMAVIMRIPDIVGVSSVILSFTFSVIINYSIMEKIYKRMEVMNGTC